MKSFRASLGLRVPTCGGVRLLPVQQSAVSSDFLFFHLFIDTLAGITSSSRRRSAEEANLSAFFSDDFLFSFQNDLVMKQFIVDLSAPSSQWMVGWMDAWMNE